MRYYSSTAGLMSLTGSIGAATTTIGVSTTVGLPVSFPYTLVLEPGIAGQEEIVTVTAASGTNLTVVRGQDGTSGVVHDLGAAVRHMITARDLRESREHEAATSAHGVTSEVVGTKDAQTLDNKTFEATGDHTALVVRDASGQTAPAFALKDSGGVNRWTGSSWSWSSDAINLYTAGAANLFGLVADVKPPNAKDGVRVSYTGATTGYAFRARKDNADKFTVDLDGNGVFAGSLASPTVSSLDSRIGALEAAATFIRTGANGTTDANGYITLNHNAPFTPRVVQVVTTVNGATLGYALATDQITSTTVRVRFANYTAGGLLQSASIGTVALISWK